MFRIYKPGQGKYTRLCTGLGAGVLAVLGSNYLYAKLQVFDNVYVQVGLPLLLLAAVGWLIFWIVNKPDAADFMIATEGEMKKVSWSSKREIMGSTKVVILFTLLMAFFLFLVDILFQWVFKSIGVLKQ